MLVIGNGPSDPAVRQIEGGGGVGLNRELKKLTKLQYITVKNKAKPSTKYQTQSGKRSYHANQTKIK
jgi:hypothetical protein